jgi:hypothetical protein
MKRVPGGVMGYEVKRRIFTAFNMSFKALLVLLTGCVEMWPPSSTLRSTHGPHFRPTSGQQDERSCRA